MVRAVQPPPLQPGVVAAAAVVAALEPRRLLLLGLLTLARVLALVPLLVLPLVVAPLALLTLLVPALAPQLVFPTGLRFAIQYPPPVQVAAMAHVLSLLLQTVVDRPHARPPWPTTRRSPILDAEPVPMFGRLLPVDVTRSYAHVRDLATMHRPSAWARYPCQEV